MVKRFLIAGVTEEGVFTASEEGTPQGGVISPLLANVYLHYVLDLWYERAFRKVCRGRTRLIRYADDCAPGEAGREMRAGPSQPGCRTRLQIALSCAGQKPG